MAKAEQKRTKVLIDRLNAGTITDAERMELRQWLESIDFSNVPLLDENSGNFEKKLNSSYAAVVSKAVRIQKRRQWIKIGWRVAAAVVLLLGLGIFWQQYAHKSTVSQSTFVQNDVPPGTSKARLILANGNSVQLRMDADSVFSQGQVQLQQANGTLAYQNMGQEKTVAYNTLIIPKGGQYEVTLADGTKVSLNAASSLKYPTQFSGNMREVELSGEAYFEIAANASKPFKVSVRGGMEVKVLGTNFNIMAYPDEKGIKTTLLEGKVQVLSGNKAKILKPGEQAVLDQASGNLLVQKANINEAVAWKNGFFLFDGADIRTIMRQLARWYDVKVTYEGATPKDRFRGKAPRNTNISQVLQVLELSGIHFKIEGKNITVMP